MGCGCGCRGGWWVVCGVGGVSGGVGVGCVLVGGFGCFFMCFLVLLGVVVVLFCFFCFGLVCFGSVWVFFFYFLCVII